MKYGIEDSVNEIKQRTKKRKREKEKRENICLSLVALGLLATLIRFTGEMSLAGGQELSSKEYASLLIFSEYGGYVLAGVIAFVLGVIVTLLCIRFKNKNRGDLV